ncbi:MAG: hypothetical protein FWH11_04210 [Micrococcales bacterium]|nr:hypothetical protein [Micrococcales bacterium]
MTLSGRSRSSRRATDREASRSTTWDVVLRAHPWDAVIAVGAPDTGFVSSAVPPDAETVVFEPDQTARDALAHALDALGTAARFEAATIVGTDDPAAGTTSLDGCLAHRGHTSACLWVDVDGGAVPVLAGGARYLGRLSRLAVVVNPAREDPSSLLHLARSWRLYLHDVRVHRLVRLPGDDPYHIQGMLDASWLDSRHAVVLPRHRDCAWRPL